MRGAVAAALPLAMLLVGLPAAAGEPGACVVEHKGRWESGYGVEWYNVVGRLKNTSGHPLAYVKLRIDAVDGKGKTVASTEAYNESAEVLTVEVEGGPKDPAERLKTAKVKPLAVDAEERFRGSFIKLRPVRDEMLIRLLVVEPERRGELLERLAEQEHQYKRQLARLLTQQRRQPASMGGEHLVRHLSLEAALLHTEAHLKWLEYCRERLMNAPIETTGRRAPEIDDLGDDLMTDASLADPPAAASA